MKKAEMYILRFSSLICKNYFLFLLKTIFDFFIKILIFQIILFIFETQKYILFYVKYEYKEKGLNYFNALLTNKVSI